MTVEIFKEKYGYEIEGVWVPRVTAIISMANGWYMLRNSNGFAARIGLQQAAEWGNITHETVENSLRGERKKIDAKIAIGIEAFEAWYEESLMNVLDPENDIEKRVYDMQNGYAGTIDIIAQVDGVLSVIDLKTSTGIWREHAVQTAAYINAYNRTAGVKQVCSKRWILRIDQYQECIGCLAKRREKYGRARVAGGKEICNHQWSATRGEIEFKELKNYEKDIKRFFDLKDRWEWNNKEWLSKIPNYEKNIRQRVLL